MKIQIIFIDKSTIIVYAYIKEATNMSISATVKALLSLTGKKQSDLMTVLGMSSKQSMSNKIRNERWDASDIVKIADFCGCKLAIIMPNGQQLIFEPDKEEKSPDGETSED